MRSILSRLRRTRPVDPEPPRDWIDWQGVGLPTPTRYDAQWPDVRAAEAGGWAGGDLAAMAAPLPGRSCLGCGYTPPDADTCVVGACVPGYHEVALIPLPGMARDDLGDYAEPVETDLTAEQIDAMRVDDPTTADPDDAMCLGADKTSRYLCTLPKGHPGRQHVAGGIETVCRVWPVDPPRGRHRQTDPFDLILADLRDLDGLS